MTAAEREPEFLRVCEVDEEEAGHTYPAGRPTTG